LWPSEKAENTSGFLEDEASPGKGGGWRRVQRNGIYRRPEGLITMNKRVTIEMPDEMMKLVEEYAAEAGSAPDAYMREVIEQHLEDLHDIALAEAAMERLKNGERTYTWEEMEREVGVED
jgi:RHH-type rel operon transcriptional repressor/antitoxin RelB